MEGRTVSKPNQSSDDGASRGATDHSRHQVLTPQRLDYPYMIIAQIRSARQPDNAGSKSSIAILVQGKIEQTI